MILSIDWDYFCNENPLWDLGHRENQMFLNFMWQTRGCLAGEMKTSGQEVGFWSRIREIVDPQSYEIHVSESHLSAYRLVEREEGPLILVDAHHDCWPFALRGKDKWLMECSNWVSAWIRIGKTYGVERQVFWVAPSKEAASLYEGKIQKEVRKNVLTTTMDELARTLSFFVKQKVNIIHACRSGCWTPPWLDKSWLAFLKASQLEIKAMDPEPWDGIRERWTESDLQNAIALDTQLRRKLQVIPEITIQEDEK